ncbi:MAG: DedA family protein [Nanoarchaeota archaeon]
MSLESVLISFGYIAIFIFMITNGFSNLPSSQLLYVIIGYFISQGNFNIYWVIGLGTIGNLIGMFILEEFSRKKGPDLFHKIKNPRFQKEVRKANVVFKRKGAYFFFISRLISPLKLPGVIAAGIAKMNRILFTIIAIVTGIIWAAIFISLGYFFGKSFENFTLYGPLVLVVTLLFVYVYYKYSNSKAILKEVEKSDY